MFYIDLVRFHRFLAALGLILIASAEMGVAKDNSREINISGLPGIRITVENEGTPGDNPGGRLLQIVQNYESQLGQAAPSTPPKVSSGPGGTFAAVTRQFTNDRGFFHAFVTSAEGGAVCHVRLAAGIRMKASFAAALKRCGTELKQQASVPASEPSTTQPETPQTPAKIDSTPQHPENWTSVQGVYFRTVTGFGVGGMVISDFEPVVFFRDGTYYEVHGAAIEDIDLAAEKRVKPKRWGRWRQTGETYYLTRSDGRTLDYKLQGGGFFRAFAAESGGSKLIGRYQRVSGGGNTAMGGEVMVAISDKLTFTQDGRFLSRSSVAATNSGSQTGVASTVGSDRRMAAPGSYQLDRHTLVMRYPDGHVERRFFAFSSRKSPPQLSLDMIFIGDSTYTKDD